MIESDEMDKKRQQLRVEIRRKMLQKQRLAFLEKMQTFSTLQQQDQQIHSLGTSQEQVKGHRKQVFQKLEQISLAFMPDLPKLETLQTLQQIYLEMKEDQAVINKIMTVLLRILNHECYLCGQFFEKFLSFITNPDFIVMWVPISKLEIPQIKEFAATFFVRNFSSESLLSQAQVPASLLTMVIFNFTNLIPKLSQKTKITLIPLLSYLASHFEPDADIKEIISALRSMLSQNPSQIVRFLMNKNCHSIFIFLLERYPPSSVEIKCKILQIWKAVFQSEETSCGEILSLVGFKLYSQLIKDLEDLDYKQLSIQLAKRILEVIKLSMKSGQVSLTLLIQINGYQFLKKYLDIIIDSQRLVRQFSKLLLSFSISISFKLLQQHQLMNFTLNVFEEMLNFQQVMIRELCLEGLNIMGQKLMVENAIEPFVQHLSRTKMKNQIQQIYNTIQHNEVTEKAQALLNICDHYQS